MQRHGVYHMKTSQERELDRRVRERKRELMESYQAQKEEKIKSITSRTFSNSERDNREEESISTSEKRRWREEDEVEGRVLETTVTNGLHSAPVPQRRSPPESEDLSQLTRTPSFRLNAGRYSQVKDFTASLQNVLNMETRLNNG